MRQNLRDFVIDARRRDDVEADDIVRLRDIEISDVLLLRLRWRVWLAGLLRLFHCLSLPAVDLLRFPYFFDLCHGGSRWR